VLFFISGGMMATAWIANLVTRREAICAELAALTASAAGGKPNNSSEGGGTDHVGYKDGLYRELAQIDKMLAEAGVDANGTVWGDEIITEART
jgi:hypothetical protein